MTGGGWRRGATEAHEEGHTGAQTRLVDASGSVRSEHDYGDEGGGGWQDAQGPLDGVSPQLGGLPPGGGGEKGRPGVNLGAGGGDAPRGRVHGVAGALGREQGVNTPAQGELGGTLPPSNARRVGRPRGASTEVSRLRQQVDQLQRDVAQLRRNNADTPSVVTRGNATPIMPSPDLAQLKGKIETLEKDLRDTRKKRNNFHFDVQRP